MTQCTCCKNRISLEHDLSVPLGGVQVFIDSPEKNEVLAVILDGTDTIKFIRSLMLEAGISNISKE